MSEGSRSGVNWMRRNSSPMTWARERAIKVLASPGKSSMRTWPLARTPTSRRFRVSRLPTITFSTSVRMASLAAATSLTWITGQMISTQMLSR